MGILRYVHQAPRLLQILWLLALTLSLAAVAILVSALLSASAMFGALLSGPQAGPFPGGYLSFMRLVFLGMTLGMLGGACAWPGNAYMAHMRHPGRARFWLASWQAQALAALTLAALPLGALAPVLALFSPDATPANDLFSSVLFVVVAAVNVIEAIVLLVAYLWIAASNFI